MRRSKLNNEKLSHHQQRAPYFFLSSFTLLETIESKNCFLNTKLTFDDGVFFSLSLLIFSFSSYNYYYSEFISRYIVFHYLNVIWLWNSITVVHLFLLCRSRERVFYLRLMYFVNYTLLNHETVECTINHIPHINRDYSAK